jgi:hypothetical protein
MNNIGNGDNMNNQNNNNNQNSNFRNILDNDFLNDMYESFVNEMVSMPLTSYRQSYNRQQSYIRPQYYNRQQYNYDNYNDINNAMRLNSRIINNIYNIRRQLELQTPTRHETFYPPNFNYNYPLAESFGIRQNTRRVPDDIEISRRIRTSTSFIDNALPSIQIMNDSFIDNIQNMFDNILEQYTQTFEDVKITLTKEQFLKLENYIIDTELLNEYEGKDCNICIETYKKDDKIVILPCNHVFHNECIENWLCNEKVTCPICRKDVREYINNINNTDNDNQNHDENDNGNVEIE